MSHTSLVMPGVIASPSGSTWDDLVLPDQSIQSLREYVLWVTHRDEVKRKWGGKIAGGPIALFSGPSGTGKTFAGGVLGKALGLELYTVDLGQLVGKYIAETEKNLDALFDAVTNEPMVLLFDEADSLFGKRAEVNDANNEYANLEVSFLLSRLERYKGPSVIATSGQKRFDPGVMLKFQFVIDFPLPDAAARSRLWRLYLPVRAPIDRDVDTDDLAKNFELAGGQIRNAALHAAFLAAGDSSSITSKHLIRAIKAELSKSGNS